MFCYCLRTSEIMYTIKIPRAIWNLRRNLRPGMFLLSRWWPPVTPADTFTGRGRSQVICHRALAARACVPRPPNPRVPGWDSDPALCKRLAKTERLSMSIPSCGTTKPQPRGRWGPWSPMPQSRFATQHGWNLSFPRYAGDRGTAEGESPQSPSGCSTQLVGPTKPTCISITAGTFESPMPSRVSLRTQRWSPWHSLSTGTERERQPGSTPSSSVAGEDGLTRHALLRLQLFGSMCLFTNDVCKCNYYISFYRWSTGCTCAHSRSARANTAAKAWDTTLLSSAKSVPGR